MTITRYNGELYGGEHCKTDRQIILHLMDCFSDANWQQACALVPELCAIEDEIVEKEEQENP